LPDLSADDEIDGKGAALPTCAKNSRHAENFHSPSFRNQSRQARIQRLNKMLTIFWATRVFSDPDTGSAENRSD
jgi:hypothetical protein